MSIADTVATSREVDKRILALSLLFGGIGLGVVASVSPILAVGLVGLVFWILVCIVSDSAALFVIGALVPSLYLFASQADLLSKMELVADGLIGTYVLFRFGTAHKVRGDKRLVTAILLWGCYIWLSMNLGRMIVDGWEPKYLVVTGTFLLPYAWFMTAGPSLGRLHKQPILLAGIVAGTLLSAGVFLLRTQPWSALPQSDSLAVQTFAAVGSLKNSVGLSWTLGFGILLTWKAKRGRWVRFGGLALLATAVAYSFSRSAYLALAAINLVYAWYRLRNRWLSVLVLCGLAIFLMPAAIWQRLALTWSTETGFDVSSAARLVLLQAGIKAFLTSPISGIGMESFASFVRQSGYLLQFGGDEVLAYDYSYVHNYFISLFALTGLIGGISALAVFWLGYDRSLQSRQQGIAIGFAVQLCILAVFITSLFGEPLFEVPMLTLFVMLLASIAFVRTGVFEAPAKNSTHLR